MAAPKSGRTRLDLSGLTDSLMGGSVSEPAAGLVSIPLSSIIEDPRNPRASFDEKELAELADSVRANGILQPVTVRPADAFGKHMLKYGHRRFRAAELAGLDVIPAIVSEGVDEADELARQVIENDQRAGLSLRDMSKAVLDLQALGLTQKEIGSKLGRGQAIVSLWASFAEYPPEIQALENLGIRTLHELNKAYGLDPDGTLEFIKRGGVSRSTAETLLANLKAQKSGVTQPPGRTETAPPAPPANIASAISEPAAPQLDEQKGEAQAPKVQAAPQPVPPIQKPEPTSIVEPLRRLFEAARHDNEDGENVARFLLAYHNAEKHGGFDISELFMLDHKSARDIAKVIVWMVEQPEAVSFEGLGLSDEIEKTVQSWPNVTAL